MNSKDFLEGALRLPQPPEDDQPIKRGIYKHIKSNGYYWVLSNGVLEKDLSKQVIYTPISEDHSRYGMIFIRPKKEFHEKFKKVKLK